MTHNRPQIDFSKLSTYSIHDRKSKVSLDDFASAWQPGQSFKDFLVGLPDILGGIDIKKVIASTVTAIKNNQTVMMAMGAHVIKVGLNPLIIQMLEKGIIKGLALNGAGIIHDTELALAGKTSEDVSAALGDGQFGMAKETAEFICNAIQETQKTSEGLGEAMGRAILDARLPYANKSLIANCVRLGIPITVHVAIGTDIVHMHHEFNAAAAGDATHRDFKTFCSLVATLTHGVYFNIGSAVILPEVFLKALTLTRNLGFDVHSFTAINMDFIRQYRPLTNVVNRPTASNGLGINLVGHHEILLPIIAWGIMDMLT
ncbi:MAG: hypothetical protein OMM_02641 [Candidatus Magnetoglobus multicellularis str. Araruama]|uniref:Uncharacterized protein n=1 Tax=Candidatus Magnetoglobus multicellularis str. Araruama TaxID=890399 RepID=A0A1V1P8Q0_9BACT|nr:MAG: hypothetical protein OMM_02641 [Candidatus Magnetoglobus multicellularis str. Araruama]